ncbi:MAG: hypothetical protein HQL13_00745 [Candidatus Omnitrophica bacterium]|nr:hypothetical protein [Candidatus Omnitrophota bacterium]
MKKITLITIFCLLFNFSPVFAMNQITCKSKSVTALNQTIKDPAYFNQLFNTNDCVVIQVADPAPLTPAAQQALINTQMAGLQQSAQIDAQMDTNRKAYIDALISKDTAKQQTIAAAQSQLAAQRAQIQ